MIEIEGLRIAGIYLFLKEREAELDNRLSEMVLEIEQYLYDILSIDEMENLRELYREKNKDLELKL